MNPTRLAATSLCLLFTACGISDAAIGSGDEADGTLGGELGGTWTLDAQPVKVVGTIQDFDKGTYARDLDLHPEVSNNWFRKQAMGLALSELKAGVNPPAPRSFTPASWDRFVESREYRGITHLWGQQITCVNGQITSRINPGEQWSGGFTPQRTGSYTSGQAYAGSVSFQVGLTHELTQQGTCAKSTSRRASRINDTERNLGRIAFGFDAPFIWTTVSSEVCCNRTQVVSVDSSLFPTRTLYVNDVVVKENPQWGFARFIVSGGKDNHPAGVGNLAPAGYRMSHKATAAVRP